MGDTVPVAAPLAGRRVVTTRGAGADDRLAALLREAGARVVSWSTCAYPPPRDPAPLESALARLEQFDWVVCTSARAVEAVMEAAAGVGTRVPGPLPPAAGAAPSSPSAPAALPRVAVVGPATARAATMAGWAVVVEGRGPGARGLAAQVAVTVPLAGARVLFPAASGAALTVEEEFTAVGARVTRADAYRTVVTPPSSAAVRADLAAGVDAVTFASPAAVEAVDRALGGAADDAPPGDTNRPLAGAEAHTALLEGGRTPRRPGDPGPAGELARALAGVVVVCIGPTTGAALARRGVGGVRVAATATLEGMVDALVAGLRGEGGGAPSGGGGRADADSGREGRATGGHADAVVGRDGARSGERADADSGRGVRCSGGRADAVAARGSPVAARPLGGRP